MVKIKSSLREIDDYDWNKKKRARHKIDVSKLDISAEKLRELGYDENGYELEDEEITAEMRRIINKVVHGD